MNRKRIFIGVAWPYVNGDLHPGHLAGYLLPADIFARFQRLLGNKVLMVSGSDCFGTPTTVEADKRGVSPEKIVAEYHSKRLELFFAYNISFDLFTRTDTLNHQSVVQEIFLALAKKGYLEKRNSWQYFSDSEQKFLPDRYVEGECPFCGNKEARGDQCENCGKVIDPKELKNPRAKLNKGKVSLKETEHFFLQWEKLQLFLEKYFAEKKPFWREWIQKETAGWLKKGLASRAITRDLNWGVPIPNEALPMTLQIKNAENKRIYVWFEAVIGYLSAAIEWGEEWKEYWYNKYAVHYYFMGKDNLVFHTLFWPGQLYAYDETIHLPDYPIINHFLNLEGKKFSKSRGITLDSLSLAKTYGADVVRSYLCYIMPENSDANWSHKDFVEFTNHLLIGNFANFINRVLKLSENIDLVKPFTVDKEVIDIIIQYQDLAKKNLQNCNFKEYLQTVFKLSSFGNEYIAKNEPWKLAAEKKENILKNEMLIVLSLLLVSKPLMPETNKQLVKMLGVDFPIWEELKIDNWLEKLKKVKILNPRCLFKKIEN